MPIEFKRVSLLEHFYARLWDSLMFWVIYLGFSIVASIVTFTAQLGVIIAALLAYIFYLFRDGYNEGGGYGKNKRGIAVINLDNLEVCNYPRSLLRNVISDVSVILIAVQVGPHELTYKFAILLIVGIDVWRILKSDGGRRVGDIIAHTQVVYWDDYLQVKASIEKEEKEIQESINKLAEARKLRDQLKKQDEPSGTAITPSTLKWRSLISQITPGKKWEWGIGWIIIAYLFFSPQESKTYLSFGTAGLLVQLVGCFLSLALYFYLRQQLFLKINKTWLRSLLAGLVASIFVWQMAPLSVNMLLKSYNKKLSELIRTEVQGLDLYFQEFTKKDQTIWENYLSDPQTNQEIHHNITLLQSAIPLYHQKDSLVIAILQKIYLAMLNAPRTDSLAQPYQIQNLKTKTQNLADADQQMLSSLIRYNNSVLLSDADTRMYMQSFQSALVKCDAAAQECATLFKQYSGREVGTSYQEYKQKYNR